MIRVPDSLSITLLPRRFPAERTCSWRKGWGNGDRYTTGEMDEVQQSWFKVTDIKALKVMQSSRVTIGPLVDVIGGNNSQFGDTLEPTTS